MELHFLSACAILGLVALCVTGQIARQKKKAKDHERRRRIVQNLRMALEE